MPKTRLPYDQMEQEYVEGIVLPDAPSGLRTYPSLDELAARWHCSVQSMRNYSLEHAWVEKRRRQQALVQYEREIARQEKLATFKARFEDMTLNIISSSLAMAEQQLEAAKRRSTPLSLNSLDQIGKLLTSFQRSGRLMLGEPTENTTQRVEAAFQEQQRFDASFATDEELELIERMARDIEERKRQAAVVGATTPVEESHE